MSTRKSRPGVIERSETVRLDTAPKDAQREALSSIESRPAGGQRAAHQQFMPRLWDYFVYPMSGGGFDRARRVALRSWCSAFKVRVILSDV